MFSREIKKLDMPQIIIILMYYFKNFVKTVGTNPLNTLYFWIVKACRFSRRKEAEPFFATIASKYDCLSP